MANLVIQDLNLNRELDNAALASFKGGANALGRLFSYPLFQEGGDRSGLPISLNQNILINKITNQIQVSNVLVNSGPNSDISVLVNQSQIATN